MQSTSTAKHETVNTSSIEYLQRVFNSADQNGGGDLDEAEFIEALSACKLSTADGSDENALKKLFYRIDANCDGTVDWDEFSLYMLLEQQGTAEISEDEHRRALTPPAMLARPVPGDAHAKIIDCCTLVPPCGGASTRYATGARDGNVKLWDCKDLSLSRTIATGKSWVTAVRYMPVFKALAVTTFARSVTLYDITSPFCSVCGAIPKMDFTPMSMDVLPCRGEPKSQLVVIGDSGGLVHVHKLVPRASGEAFQDGGEVDRSEGRPKAIDRYSEELMWSQIVHSKWVTKVQCVRELESAVSASLDGLLWVMDIERRTPFLKLEGHSKGVLTCDWSSTYKAVASGGADKSVCVFNPFSGKRQAVMTGHAATVTDVAVNDGDRQIISLSADKVVKVWDIRTFRCLQTLADREVYKPDDTITGLLYDGARGHAVAGNTRLKAWRLEAVEASGVGAHGHPVSAVVYNRVFEDVVSADRAGTVCVWNARTGALRFRFTKAHGSNAITCIAFDAAHRRLITGSEAGELRVWNFSSGACLMDLESSCTKDITGIVCSKGAVTRYVIAAGWDKRVTFWEDSRARHAAACRQVPHHGPAHDSDVLACALMDDSPNLVTASAGGELKVWNIESGVCRKVLCWPGMQAAPRHTRGVEELAFVAGVGRLKHVCVAVGGDQIARFWDAAACRLLHEHFLGHLVGESVLSVALSATSRYMATGDSAGVCKTWDVAALMDAWTAHGCDARPADGAIVPVAAWRAHSRSVTSICAMGGEEAIFVSSSLDCTVATWHVSGSHVGTFGTHQWSISDRATWNSTARQPLGKADFQQMCASLPPPYLGASSGPPEVAHHQREGGSPADDQAPPLPPATEPGRPPRPPGQRQKAAGLASPSGRQASRRDDAHGTARDMAADRSPGDLGLGGADDSFTASGGHGRTSEQTLAQRDQQRAWESVEALLAEPGEVANRCAGPNLDGSSSDGDVDDRDLPASLWTDQFKAVSTLALPGGDGPLGRRPQTAHLPKPRPATALPHVEEQDGIQRSPGGQGQLRLRPHSAAAGCVLSPQEKRERMKAYTPPRPKAQEPGIRTRGVGHFQV